MKGIDGGYKLSELLFGRGGSADAIVNVAAVELRFWAVVLAKKLMFELMFYSLRWLIYVFNPVVNSKLPAFYPCLFPPRTANKLNLKKCIFIFLFTHPSIDFFDE